MISHSYTACDGDGWQWWVEQSPVSYHKSLEGAQNRVKSLIEDELANLEANKLLNPHLIDGPYYPEQEKNIRNNILSASVGDGGRCTEECELFVITPLCLED